MRILPRQSHDLISIAILCFVFSIRVYPDSNKISGRKLGHLRYAFDFYFISFIFEKYFFEW